MPGVIRSLPFPAVEMGRRNTTPGRRAGFKPSLEQVPARVLADGNGAFTVQTAGLDGNRREYTVRVFGGGADAGNYRLDVGFGFQAARTATFAEGALATAEYTLYVGRTQLFGLALSAAGAGGSVRVEVRRAGDPAGAAPVVALQAPAGDTVTGLTPLLPPGEYRVAFTRVEGQDTGNQPLAFRLDGNGLTDPVGPVAGSGTLAAQCQAPGSPGQFQYPVGRLTFDPYLWVFRAG